MTADGSAHPALDLDDTVHQRVRLGILAVLSETTECTFAVLRDELDLTDGNLSVHLRKLEGAGYVAIDKRFVGRRPQTNPPFPYPVRRC